MSVKERQHRNRICSDPRYGRLKRNQAQFLQRHYKIIMWDVLSGDFDQNIDPQKCYFNVIKNTQPGSIIVFHDSLKAEKNLRFVLPKVLNYFQDMGYRFESLHHLEEKERQSD